MEILLPKAMVDKLPAKKTKELKTQIPHLKMVELWAQNPELRKGWLKVIGLNWMNTFDKCSIFDV